MCEEEVTIRGDAEATSEGLRSQRTAASQRFESGDEVGNPRGVRQSRERSTAPHPWIKTLRRRRRGQPATDPAKRERGLALSRVQARSNAHHGGKKPRRGPSPGRHSQRSVSKPHGRGRDFRACDKPRRSGQQARSWRKLHGGCDVREGERHAWKEQSLEGSNPRSGTGMEQARQVMGGARRRESAKL